MNTINMLLNDGSSMLTEFVQQNEMIPVISRSSIGNNECALTFVVFRRGRTDEDISKMMRMLKVILYGILGNSLPYGVRPAISDYSVKIRYRITDDVIDYNKASHQFMVDNPCDILNK